jgi:signal peptidase I
MSNINYEPTVSAKEIRDYIYPSFWHEIKDYLFYLIKVFSIVAVIFIFYRTFVLDLIEIQGQSMAPNYNAVVGSQDKIFINKLTPKFSTLARGQVVVLIAPQGCRTEKTLYIKRIIGLPGETIRLSQGDVYIINEQYPSPGIKLDESQYLAPTVKSYKRAVIPDSQEIIEVKVPNNQYYFMGDNRSGSQDSRACGPIQKDQVIGIELYRQTPIEKQKFFELPSYKIGNQ